jgi:hypothetical protein
VRARSQSLTLHPGDRESTGSPVADRGRLMSAPDVAQLVCDGRLSARWVIERMGPTIGLKPGREWLFYEADARKWWAKYLERGKGGRQ